MTLKHGPLDNQSPLSGSQTVPNAELVPSNGMVAGETIAQWTQDWWTWALQSPAATSPQMDTTGAFANVNNSGAMFFVAGSFGGDVAREFDVPAGKPLLLPVLNNIALQYTGTGPDPLTGGKGAASIVTTDWQKGVTNLFMTIDGKTVGDLQSDLVRTSWFSPGTPQPGSLIESFGFTGDLGPAKSDGYWAVLTGFTAGSTHTLDFGGAWNGGSVHIHDTVHVV